MTDWSQFTLEELEEKFGPKTYKKTGGRRKPQPGPGPVDRFIQGPVTNYVTDVREGFKEQRAREDALVDELSRKFMYGHRWDQKITPTVEPRRIRAEQQRDLRVGRRQYEALKSNQISESTVIDNLSKPINDLTNRSLPFDPGAWNVPEGLVERTMGWNLNPKGWFSPEKGVVPSVLGGEEWISSPLNKILSTQGSKKGDDTSDLNETARKWKGASEILKNVAAISSLWDEDEHTWMGTGFSFMG